MNLKITISIDDVNPQKGYRILGDKTETWLRQLNDEFGAKYTLFIPSNYHGKYPLSEHKEWINELNNIDWIETASHGHFHQTSNSQLYGECEWYEITGYEARKRYQQMMAEWDEVELIPNGWRNPGWLINPLNIDIIQDNFEYVALHYDHNRNFHWNCKTFFGHDGIQQENISVHNDDMIMLQSHIAGKHNHNVWNEQNYEQLRISLSHLYANFQIEPKLLKECCS